MSEYKVQFTIDPGDFREALREVNRYVDSANGFLYVAAIDPDRSPDLWRNQANAPDEEKGPRVVLGLEGEGTSYCFVDVEAESVSQPGEFIIGAANRLKNWANAVEENTQITYSNDDSGQTLRLDYPNGYDTIPVRVWYTENNFDHCFGAHKLRFVPPKTAAYDEDLNEMLSVANDLAPSSSDLPRSGDLVFGPGQGSPIQVKFITLRDMANSAMMAGTSQVLHLDPDYCLSDIEWQVQDRHLALLEEITQNTSSTARINYGEEENESDLVEIAYESDGLYVERMIEVRRDKNPIDMVGWTDRDALFGPQSASEVYSAVPASQFFRELEKTWSLSESKVIQAATNVSQGESVLELKTEEKTNQKTVKSENGGSSISSYLLVPSSKELMESIVRDAKFLQIRSFPVEGEESDNSYVVLPVGEDQNPTAAQRPNRFLTITAGSG